jgi:hypothetical protein
MRFPQHPTLLRRVQAGRLKRLRTIRPFVAATLVQIHARCGNTGCHCATGVGHPRWQLTLKRAGQTVAVYVPQATLPEVRGWVDEYQAVKRLLHEISELSLARLAAQAKLKRTQRRRR